MKNSKFLLNLQSHGIVVIAQFWNFAHILKWSLVFIATDFCELIWKQSYNITSMGIRILNWLLDEHVKLETVFINILS